MFRSSFSLTQTFAVYPLSPVFHGYTHTQILFILAHKTIATLCFSSFIYLHLARTCKTKFVGIERSVVVRLLRQYHLIQFTLNFNNFCDISYVKLSCIIFLTCYIFSNLIRILYVKLVVIHSYKELYYV